MEAAAIPLPRDDKTPPVMKIYLVLAMSAPQQFFDLCNIFGDIHAMGDVIGADRCGSSGPGTRNAIAPGFPSVPIPRRRWRQISREHLLGIAIDADMLHKAVEAIFFREGNGGAGKIQGAVLASQTTLTTCREQKSS